MYGKRLGVRFLVEEMLVSNEYRVLMLDGEVISCVQKIPAGITSDGISTIKKLVHDFNTEKCLRKTNIRSIKKNFITYP